MHSVPENLQASSNTTRSPGSVFISYSRKDYYFAESLTFALIQRDVAAWLDVKELRPGVDWEQRLESAIDTASHLVLVASSDSLCSPHVAAEWKRALARGIPVIVAHLRGNNVPPELTAMPRVNFHSRFRPAVDSLVTRLTNYRFRSHRTKPDAFQTTSAFSGWCLKVDSQSYQSEILVQAMSGLPAL
jgi:hypothetical protein